MKQPEQHYHSKPFFNIFNDEKEKRIAVNDEWGRNSRKGKFEILKCSVLICKD